MHGLCALRAADWTSAINGPTIAAWNPLGIHLPVMQICTLLPAACVLLVTTGLNIDLLNFLSLSDFVYGSEAAHGGWRRVHFFLLVLAIG